MERGRRHIYNESLHNLRTPANIRINLISPETKSTLNIYAADSSLSVDLYYFNAIVLKIPRKNSRRTCAKTEFNVTKMAIQSHSRSYILQSVER